jgi:predicted ATP pyrophosphatase (TIGR00289 family)
MRPAPYSMMFHHPNIEWTKLQAEAMGLPQIFVKPKEGQDKPNAQSKSGQDERAFGLEELDALENALSELHIDGIFAGAIDSDYQKQRIDKIGENLGIPTHSPLWRKNEPMYSEVLEYFETYIIAVSAEGLGPELLGTKFQIQKAKGVHPFFEGGEGETFVTNAPFFHKRIIIDKWEKEWDGVRGVAKIVSAHLQDKS